MFLQSCQRVVGRPALPRLNVFWAGWLLSSSSRKRFSCVVVIFASSANLSGCARGLPDPGINVDRSIETASVIEPAGEEFSNAIGLDTDTLRDAETIAKAVSSVQFSGKFIPWQNPSTGSSGDIIAVNEQRAANGVLCRNFTALRTSYDGIRNYAGSVCMNDAGVWRLKSFNPS
jgi:surface antigen